MKELIETQIEQAAKALGYADYQIGKMQEREKSTPEEKTLGYLSAYCERLLQIVQNQQSQIEELKRSSLRVLTGSDLCECGHALSLHGEKACGWIECECRQFRLRGVR